MNIEPYYLFLDDMRMPHEVALYFEPQHIRSVYEEQKWIIVRSYNEFVTHITENGLPVCISFDHDLADEHYNQANNDEDYKEKTGYECAKWLVEFLIEHNLELPVIYCHSMNPVGKQNILKLFENFQKNR
jgi:hypothetical protein